MTGPFYTDTTDAVDIYDANSNSWSTATLSVERRFLAAATVGDKAFFAGGRDINDDNCDAVDIYDAKTDQWSTTTLSQARRMLTATSVGSQAVFAGGVHGRYSPSNVVDVYTLYLRGDFEPDGDLDLADYAVLAAAWKSTPGDDNWNQACDVSEPNDNVVDERDLSVLSDDWLEIIE
jgi:hypothetical protein